MKKIALLCVILIPACAGNQANQKSAGRGSDADKSGQLAPIGDSPRCDGTKGREELMDLNQDGRADVRKILGDPEDKPVLLCREADINFDGIVELVEHYDENGAKKRDEADLDFDKKMDVVTWFSGGQVIKQELDTNADGIADRVRYIENGVPVRLEGDTNQDGRVDYWEYFEEGKLTRIGTDSDGDGRADKWDRDEIALAEARKAEGGEAEATDTDTATEDAAEPAKDESDKKDTKDKKEEKARSDKADKKDKKDRKASETP